MSDQMISIIGKLIAAVFVGVITYLAPRVKAWLESHTSKTDQEKLKILITSFAEAAEQLLHDSDDDGSLRMDYVKKQLSDIGIAITADVVSMIEGAVWEINNQNRKNFMLVADSEVTTNGYS